MIERHRKLTNDLRTHLEIERILVSQACNDLIEVNKIFDLCVKLCRNCVYTRQSKCEIFLNTPLAIAIIQT